MEKEDIIIALIKSENAATRAEVSNMIAASSVVTSQSIEALERTLREHNGRLKEGEIRSIRLEEKVNNHVSAAPSKLVFWMTEHPKVSIIIIIAVLFLVTIIVNACGLNDLIQLIS